MKPELTPLKAIRKKCMDCSADNRAEVRNCVIPDCPLHRYRMGRNPARKGVGGGEKNLRVARERCTE